MKKRYYIIEFPLFTHTHSIEKTTDFITVEVMVEGEDWQSSDLEKAVAQIAEPRLYKLSGVHEYGTGSVQSSPAPDHEAAFTSTNPDFRGVYVGDVYRTTKK